MRGWEAPLNGKALRFTTQRSMFETSRSAQLRASLVEIKVNLEKVTFRFVRNDDLHGRRYRAAASRARLKNSAKSQGTTRPAASSSGPSWISACSCLNLRACNKK